MQEVKDQDAEMEQLMETFLNKTDFKRNYRASQQEKVSFYKSY